MGGFKRQQIAEGERRQSPMLLGQLLTDAIDIFCWCNRCGHNAVLPVRDLVQRLGPDCPVPEAGSRLRCSVCTAKDVATRPNWPSAGPITRHG